MMIDTSFYTDAIIAAENEDAQKEAIIELLHARPKLWELLSVISFSEDSDALIREMLEMIKPVGRLA